MKIKKEVKELCAQLVLNYHKAQTYRYDDPYMKKYREIKEELITKYGFCSYSLLTLFYDPPVLEYTIDQIDLIMEKMK